MKILDLDLDYFLDSPVFNRDHSSDERVEDEECVNSVWSEDRVRDFFENHLGLSRKNKVPGRILKGHDEALYFWEELVEKGSLVAPFSVIHIDSHADLGFGGRNVQFVLEDLPTYPLECRKSKYCKDYEVDGYYGNIDIGDFLLFAVAFGLISKITFCANPLTDVGYAPAKILVTQIPETLSIPKTFHIRFRIKNDGLKDSEVIIPYHIVQSVKDVNFDGNYAFASIAQSPNYTPQSADYILDIFREYIIEV